MPRFCKPTLILLGFFVLLILSMSPIQILSIIKEPMEDVSILQTPKTPFTSRTQYSSTSPPLPGSDVFIEDFFTTNYIDGGLTNVSGWGTGSVGLPRMTPTLAGSLATGGHSRNVVVAGNFAYIACQSIFRVIDISDPTTPTYAGAWSDGGLSQDVHISGNYAYIADDTGDLKILDISNPATPTLAGGLSLPGQIWSVWVAGDFAYLGDGWGTFYVINVTDPTAPVQVGSCSTDSTYDVQVVGDYAYLADETTNLRVVDIKDPTNPTIVATYSTGNRAVGLFVEGDYVYVADRYAGLHIADISNPLAPTYAASISMTTDTEGVFVEGNYAYVANLDEGLKVVDITDPTSPSIVGSYDTVGSSYGVCVDGNYAYMADGLEGLQIVKISDPTNPTIVATYSTGNRAVGLFVEGDYVYVADRYAGLHIADISNPLAPTYAASISMTTDTEGVFVEGNYAYVANLDEGLKVVDITDPTSPSIVGSYDTPGLSNGVWVAGNYVYIADGFDGGLQVINITDPTNPLLAGWLNTPGNARRVVVDGNYAFVADQTSLRVIDISDPTTPTYAGAWSDPGLVQDVHISGNYAYIADDTNDLRILDISNPATPTLAGGLSLPGQIWSVWVAGDFAYLGDGWGVFYVINVTDPTAPVQVGSCSTDSTYDVQVVGDYAYLADETTNLRVVEVAQNRVRKYEEPAQAQSLTVFSGGSATSLVRATLTSVQSVPSGTAIQYYLSADNGLHWEQVIRGSSHIFTNLGNQLKWKAILSTQDILRTPTISSVTINFQTMLEPPNQISPDGGILTSDNTPFFEWTSVIGAQRYLLQLDTIDTFASPNLRDIQVVSGVTYTPSIPLTDGVWHWHVAANDSDGELGYFSDIRNLTIDTTPPTWGQTPENQILEFGMAFHYDLNASDPHWISRWWINNTIEFSINQEGVITNSTPLLMDTYGLEVFVNDSLDNAQSSTFSISVVDTTNPTWTEVPTNQIREYGSDFTYDVNATDVAGIDHYWINDTIKFSIDSAGVITNNTNMDVDEYWLIIRAYDSSNNFCESTIRITIQDTTIPSWTHSIVDQEVEYGSEYRYDLNATDLSGIETYWINNTASFIIDSNGVISNSSSLIIGTYWLTVRAYDPYNNYCEAIYKVTVIDTTAPEWEQVPVNYILELGEGFHYDLNASDLSGIAYYGVDSIPDTFQVNPTSGVITNSTPLGVGVYWLNMSAVDPYLNMIFTLISVTVQDTTAPTWTPTPENQFFEYGEMLSYQLSAFDLSGIDSWWINDTASFQIDIFGLLTNKTVLVVGQYWIEIHAIDPYGYYCSAIIMVSVENFPPDWVQLPTDRIVEFNFPLNYKLNATDPAGIDYFWVNDTTHFAIDTTGLLTNNSLLAEAEYWVEIRAYDPLGLFVSAVFRIIVEDTTPPIWLEPPLDQILELGSTFTLEVVAWDLAGIDYYWINDTTHFSINSMGTITNATNLVYGIYWLEVRAFDTHGLFCKAIIHITVRDTQNPNWVEPPTDQWLELNLLFRYDVNATDVSGISSYWINDTILFTIDNSGVITNSTPLTVGAYGLEVRAYDPYGHYASAFFSVFIQDTTNPYWDELPQDQIIELGASFYYDVNASDLGGIDHYWINDTVYFSIDNNGVITSVLTSALQEYGLEIRAYDPGYRYCSAIIKITVQDTVAPTWVVTPSNQELEFGDWFNYDVDAQDLDGIDFYWINDTINFQIGIDGYITNLSQLAVGNYGLEVRAYDSSNNFCTAIITVTVQDTIAPTWVMTPTDLTLEIGTEYVCTVYADDLAGIDQWWVDDTANFNIDPTGMITTDGVIAVGTYTLEIRAYDPSGNYCSHTITVWIEDTTPPEWIEYPEDQFLEYGQFLDYQLQAEDLSGIDRWEIDNGLFQIDSNGRLTSIGSLDSGVHIVTIFVYDPYDNMLSATIAVTVQEAPYTPPPPAIPSFPIAAIILGLILAILSVLLYRKWNKQK